MHFVLALRSGCSSQIGCAHGPYGQFNILYTTDREPSKSSGEYYGGGRAKVTYFGECAVGVLVNDRPANLRLPTTGPAIPSVAGEGILSTPSTMRGKELLASIKNAVDNSPQKRILIFVHGFNVPFIDACQACAQLTYDVNYNGAATVFDWPSEGMLFGYAADEETAQWAAPHLAQFLRQMHKAVPDARIDIVAHSLGSRVVTYALHELQFEAPDTKFPIAHVIFLAPDIDVDIFRETTMRYIHPMSKFTVYGSSKDKALRFSKWLHNHKREGERPDQYTIDVPGSHSGPPLV